MVWRAHHDALRSRLGSRSVVAQNRGASGGPPMTRDAKSLVGVTPAPYSRCAYAIRTAGTNNPK
jgi:hypothetical protein